MSRCNVANPNYLLGPIEPTIRLAHLSLSDIDGIKDHLASPDKVDGGREVNLDAPVVGAELLMPVFVFRAIHRPAV